MVVGRYECLLLEYAVEQSAGRDAQTTARPTASGLQIPAETVEKVLLWRFPKFHL